MAGSVISKKIQAKWYQPTSWRPIKWVCVHSAETRPTKGAAAAMGKFFQRLPASSQASAHVGVDPYEAVRFVEDKDIAYAAPGLNRPALHIEICGYARYSLEEWAGTGNMIAMAAQIVREWCDKYEIPMRYVEAEGLKKGMTGITTHVEVSKAFGKSNHWDPGPHFDMNEFVALVKGETTPADVIDGENEEPDMKPDDFVGIASCPGGGAWKLKYNGEIHTVAPAPYFGGIPNLPPEAKQGPQEYTGITAAGPTREDGYLLTRIDGATYHFDLQWARDHGL